MSVNPNQAILFHRASLNTHHQSMSHQFATLHDIGITDDNRPVIKEGQIMSHDCVISVLQDMVNMRQQKALQMLPENVLAHSDDSLVWYVKGGLRPMLFKRGKRSIKINVPYPTLLFKVVDNTLWIAASRYTRKPKATDVLYYAPLMNIYSDNRVCTGSAECPDNADVDSMSQWEGVIFSTYFTHTNHNNTLRSREEESTSTDELFAFWKSLKGDNKFPVSLLNKQTDLTLEEWIEE